MGIAEHLVGRTLQGQATPLRKWYVHEKIGMRQGDTPGFFSVAYRCRDESGQEAFLKASDLSKVLSQENKSRVDLLLEATQAFKFERDILEHCKGNSMDRVVLALDYGDDNIVFDGAVDFLFFLVFELAEGDLRGRILDRAELDVLWTVGALHEYAVAVNQLHVGNINHNDIKPANALVFKSGGQKIADLGRATTPLMSIPHERNQCAGDTRFAPPEQLYNLNYTIDTSEMYRFHRAGDLYNLGSLAHFLLIGTNITQEVTSRLRPEYRPPSESGGWGDSLDLVLPYWQSALTDIIQEANIFADELPDAAAQNETKFIISMIFQLCSMEWRTRGDPRFVGRPNQYDLSRYIARLDLARSRLRVALNNAK